MAIQQRLKALVIQNLSTLSLALVCAAPLQLQAQSNGNDPMPPSRNGECYGKVEVPATYATETIDVITKVATNSFKINDATFGEWVTRIQIKDSYSKLVAVQPKHKTVTEKFIIEPADTRWVRGSQQGTVPITAGDRLDLEQAGIDMATVEVGSCLYQHYIPPVMEEVTERVLISEASESIEVSFATFRKGAEKVLVKSPYKTIKEIPAKFKTIEEKVLTSPATTGWKRGTGPNQRVNNLTGQTLIPVEIPAVYKTIKKQVIETEPSVEIKSVPAEYKDVTAEYLVKDAEETRTAIPAEYLEMVRKQVKEEGKFIWLDKRSTKSTNGKPTGRAMCHRAVAAKTKKYKRKNVVEPGRVDKEVVPVRLLDVTALELDAAASSMSVAIPPEVTQVEKRTLKTPAKLVWQTIMCEDNIDKAVAANIQQSLLNKGYNITVDGRLGQGSYRVVEKFQKDEGLAVGGLTVETLKALGVKYN